MTRLFRAQLTLMIMGKYGYGNYVDDPSAFMLRVETFFKTRETIELQQDTL